MFKVQGIWRSDEPAYCSSRQQHVRMFQEEQHVLSDMQAKSSLIVDILACIRLIKISFFLKPLK